MTQGFDTGPDCSAHAAAIKAQGYGFVGRYYFSVISHHKKKLTRSEAEALSGAGLYVVAVFENSSNSAGYFTHAQGLSDGKAAFRYAADQIVQPFGSPIYFAVDYDASTANLSGGIGSYFRGIAEAFTAESQGGDTYQIGVYGSGLTCSTLAHSGAVTYTWLAQSTGWSGHDTYTTWNLKQGDSQTLFGISIDPDRSQGNGGGFQVALTGA